MCETAFSGSSVTVNGITVGEWLCTTALTSGLRAKRLAVDVALQEHAAALLIDRIGVEVELHDVRGRNQRRRARPRQQIALRIFRMPHRHMAPGVEHAVLGQDAARGDEVVDQRGIDRTGG